MSGQNGPITPVAGTMTRSNPGGEGAGAPIEVVTSKEAGSEIGTYTGAEPVVPTTVSTRSFLIRSFLSLPGVPESLHPTRFRRILYYAFGFRLEARGGTWGV